MSEQVDMPSGKAVRQLENFVIGVRTAFPDPIDVRTLLREVGQERERQIKSAARKLGFARPVTDVAERHRWVATPPPQGRSRDDWLHGKSVADEVAAAMNP